MNYRIVKEKRSTLKNYGRYRLAAVHMNTVTQEQIEDEIAANCSARPSDVKLVLTELSEVISRHLKAGDRVRLDYLGLLKLEIESEKHDSPDDFCVPRDVRALRLHVLPESRKGRQELYEDVRFVRVKD